jgi:hypothetical protein
MKTSVSYNKSTKLWEARNGDLLISDTNQNKVLLVALKHDHPEIHETIKTICRACSKDGNGHGIPTRLIDTLIKSAGILAKGKLYQDGVCRAGNGASFYILKFEGYPKKWKCNCKAFKTKHLICDYGQMCKHTFAALIAYLLKIELPTFHKGINPEESDVLTELDYYATQLEDVI